MARQRFQGPSSNPIHRSLQPVGADGMPRPALNVGCRGGCCLDGIKLAQKKAPHDELKRGNFRRLTVTPVNAITDNPNYFFLGGTAPGDLQPGNRLSDLLRPIAGTDTTFTSVNIPCMWAETGRRGRGVPTVRKQQHRLHASVLDKPFSAITPGDAGAFGWWKITAADGTSVVTTFSLALRCGGRWRCPGGRCTDLQTIQVGGCLPARC